MLRRGLPVFVRQTTGLRLVEDRGRGLDAEHRPILARRLPERAALAIFAGTDADRDQDGAGSGGHPADDRGVSDRDGEVRGGGREPGIFVGIHTNVCFVG